MVLASLVQASRRKAICAIVIATVLATPLASTNLGGYGAGVFGDELDRIMGTQGEDEEVWIGHRGMVSRIIIQEPSQ